MLIWQGYIVQELWGSRELDNLESCWDQAMRGRIRASMQRVSPGTVKGTPKCPQRPQDMEMSGHGIQVGYVSLSHRSRRLNMIYTRDGLTMVNFQCQRDGTWKSTRRITSGNICGVGSRQFWLKMEESSWMWEHYPMHWEHEQKGNKRRSQAKLQHSSPSAPWQQIPGDQRPHTGLPVPGWWAASTQAVNYKQTIPLVGL